MAGPPDAAVVAPLPVGPAPVVRDDRPRTPRGGWRVVAAKEFADGILSVRLFILIALLGLAAVAAIYSTATYVRGNAQLAAGATGLFVQLFSNQPTSSQIPSFAALVGLLGPLLGIAFGFDAVNGERAERTLARLIAQPIHRDDVINGKFAAGLAMIGLVLLAITLLVSGVAFVVLGIRPTPDDLARLGVWFVVALVYLAFWLAFAMLCSVVFRRAATSALAAIGLWIVLTLFTALLIGIVAGYLSPVPANATTDEQIANVQMQLDLSRVSPGTLYGESAAYLLDPTVQTVGIVPIEQQNDQRAIPTALPLDQSLLLTLPQVIALLALTVACFGLAYVAFMRQEVRA